MKKQNLKQGVLLLFFLIPSSFSFSQNSGTSSLSINADIMSRYIWRGINLGGSSPHIQPSITYTLGNSGLTFGAWGSYSLGNSAFAEADLYLSFTPVNWLTFTLTDYFFPNDNFFERSGYFNFNKDETGHTIEAMVTTGEFENFPLYLTFAMNIYGVDGVDETGHRQNAKYLELGYNGSTQNFAYSVFAGLAPDNPNSEMGGSGWYGNKPGVINLGLTIIKDISLAGKSFPVSSSAIFNPEAGNFYLVMGISF
jgi:hypothetical protein